MNIYSIIRYSISDIQAPVLVWFQEWSGNQTTCLLQFLLQQLSSFLSACAHFNMAEGPADFRQSIAVSLDKLEQEISCPLCLDVFNEPKKLPCDHVYCLDPCLSGLAKKSGDGTITCPECRKLAEIPDNDLSKFPPAFHVNRMKEVVEAMKEGYDQVSTDPLPRNHSWCRSHSKQSLALYCMTCGEQFCRDCILIERHHSNHQYKFISHLAEEGRDAVAKMLDPPKQFQVQITAAVDELTLVKAKIADQKAAMAEVIEASFKALATALESQKDVFIQKVEAFMDGKIQSVAAQVDSLKQTQDELETVIASAKSSIENASNLDFLSEKEKISSSVEVTMKKLTQLQLDPVEVPDAGVQVVSPSELRRVCEEQSFTYKLADPTKCTAEGEGLREAETNKLASFSLKLVDSEGRPSAGKQRVEAELKSVRDSLFTQVQVMAMSTESCTMSYKAETRGRHELSVKVNGFHIPNSPFSVFVRYPPAQIQVPVAEITNLQHPGGLACNSSGRLVTGEVDKGVVSILNQDFQPILEIKDLSSPTGVTTDKQSNIYVCTATDGKIHKFSKNAEPIKTVGGVGKKPGQFSFPDGIGMDQDDRLFVCDCLNNRVQIFDTELNLLRWFGSKGSRRGQFDFPNDVTSDCNGNVYVSDQGNHRIQVFSQHGVFLYAFGKKGKLPGELDSPVGIAHYSNMIYVADSENSRVSVFHTSGRFITTFGQGYIPLPEGLAIDQDGFVFVTCSGNEIKVF